MYGNSVWSTTFFITQTHRYTLRYIINVSQNASLPPARTAGRWAPVGAYTSI